MMLMPFTGVATRWPLRVYIDSLSFCAVATVLMPVPSLVMLPRAVPHQLASLLKVKFFVSLLLFYVINLNSSGSCIPLAKIRRFPYTPIFRCNARLFICNMEAITAKESEKGWNIKGFIWLCPAEFVILHCEGIRSPTKNVRSRSTNLYLQTENIHSSAMNQKEYED